MAYDSIWSLNSFGYHPPNHILHILVAISIYCLVNLLFGDRRASFYAAVLFMASPIHTKAVSYISGRADPLAGLFLILGLISYITSLDSRRPYRYLFTLLCFISALLSRESALIFPAILVLYHLAFKKRPALIKFVLILAVAADRKST